MSVQTKRYFTTGLVALLPIAVAAWVIISLLRWIRDTAIKPIFQAEWISSLFSHFPEGLAPWVQGFLGLVIIFFVVVLLGMLATNVVGRWFLSKIDWFMAKVPLASTVYSFVKGLVENLRIMRSGYFQKVVLVEYPRTGLWALGFITRKLEGKIQTSTDMEHVAVFIPTSPNPTSGFIVLTEAEKVTPLDMTPEEGLKFIMSGGVLMPGIHTDSVTDSD